MKTLHLVLKAEWYDMIASGEKREEYREITSYWLNRLRDKAMTCIDKVVCRAKCDLQCWKTDNCGFSDFDVVCFYRGYTKQRMIFECKGINIGRGCKKWGAPDRDVFIIRLGERI